MKADLQRQCDAQGNVLLETLGSGIYVNALVN